MQLVRLPTGGSIEINEIFSLKWIYYGLKGDILEYWGTLIFWFIILLYTIKG